MARQGKVFDMKESALVKAILSYCHIRGIAAWRNNTGCVVASYKGRRRFVRYGHKGFADIFGVLPGGRFFAIECKTDKGRTTIEQDEFIDSINAIGGLAFVARSLDDVMDNLK